MKFKILIFLTNFREYQQGISVFYPVWNKQTNKQKKIHSWLFYVFSNIQHNKTDQREALCILSECRHENQIITSIILLEEQQCNIEEHEQQFFFLWITTPRDVIKARDKLQYLNWFMMSSLIFKWRIKEVFGESW